MSNTLAVKIYDVATKLFPLAGSQMKKLISSPVRSQNKNFQPIFRFSPLSFMQQMNYSSLDFIRLFGTCSPQCVLHWPS